MSVFPCLSNFYFFQLLQWTRPTIQHLHTRTSLCSFNGMIIHSIDGGGGGGGLGATVVAVDTQHNQKGGSVRTLQSIQLKLLEVCKMPRPMSLSTNESNNPIESYNFSFSPRRRLLYSDQSLEHFRMFSRTVQLTCIQCTTFAILHFIYLLTYVQISPKSTNQMEKKNKQIRNH